MRHKSLWKRLLLIFAVMSLLLAAVPAVMMAQEEEAGTDAVAVEETAEEAEESESGGIAALGVNMGFLIAQIINFTVVAGLLTFFLWRPALNMINSRSAEIQKGLEDAAKAARDRENAEAEKEKILSEARTERSRVLEEARTQGDELKRQIESEARAEAERIRQNAQAEAEQVRNAQLADLRDEVLRISTAVASRIIDENLDEDRQRELVSNFFTRMPQGAKDLSGVVEVVSAMPLTDEEKSRVESELNGDSYKYTVDPNVLGGLVLRTSERIVDGSVRTNLNTLTSRLQ